MTDADGSKIDEPFASDDEILNMVAEFEECRWPYERWTHRSHLAVAVFYLSWLSYPEALKRIRQSIQNYNRAVGDAQGYSETLTVLFLRKVDAHMRAAAHEGRPQSRLIDMVEELVRVADARWPLLYYSEARLASPEARAGWVDPDLRQLDF
ncbi:MAG: hypothetical protein SGJ11_11680 [Phycisphaerae bacterium]|nr:hypothetical protein [Phycisphaerae bacterium]